MVMRIYKANNVNQILDELENKGYIKQIEEVNYEIGEYIVVADVTDLYKITKQEEDRNFKKELFCKEKYDKDIIESAEEILKIWNDSVKMLGLRSGISKHKSITSKVTIDLNHNISASIVQVIAEKLDKYTKEQIVKAIENYFQIINSPNSWYNHKFKNLVAFLRYKKLEEFLKDDTLYKFYMTEKQFKNKKYDNKFKEVNFRIFDTYIENPLDKSAGTYYGIPIEKIRGADLDYLYRSATTYIKSGLIRLYELEEIEFAIISCFYFRKRFDLMSKFVDLHKRYSGKVS